MEIQEAIKFMRALADGLNPETGQALPDDSICRSAQAVKALNRAVAALTAQQEREKTGRRMRAGIGPRQRMHRCARKCAKEWISRKLPRRITALSPQS